MPGPQPGDIVAAMADDALPDLEPFRTALYKRGFKREDVYYHDCPKCQKPRCVEKWLIKGKGGGRDIDMCNECGETWSWRMRPANEMREIDPDFDLKFFLKM